MSRGKPGVLVTGGAGFIGSHTVDGLLAEGCRVRVLDNLSTGRRANLPTEHPGLEVVEGDARDAATLQAAMDGITHCLHLAAQVSVERSVADPRGSAENNVLGAVNVFQAARDAGLSKVVYASSAAVYGDLDQLPLTEDAALRPSSPYGLEKRINEQYAALFRSLFELPMMGLRYFNVYGPRQDPASPYAGVISIFANCLLSDRQPRIFGDGEQTRDFVYVEDVVRTNLAALFSECEGLCNVASQHQTSLNELLDTLQTVVGRDCRPRHEPARASDIRHSMGDASRMRDWLGVVPAWPLASGLEALVSATAGSAGN